MGKKSEFYFEIYQASLICSSISAFCVIILLILFYKAKLKGLSIKLLINMSVIDLIRSFVFFFPYSYSKNFYFCQFFAIIVNGSLLSNCIWSVFIVITMNKQYSMFPEPPNMSLRIWNLYAFILVPIFQLLPILTDSYGFNEGFCSYKQDNNGYTWRFIQESFIFVLCTFGVIMYIKVYRKYVGYHFFNFSDYCYQKGMIYSIIYFFIILTVLIFRFSEIFVGHCIELAMVSYSLVSLHGFFNVVAFFLNRNYRIEIRRLYQTNVYDENLGSFFNSII